MRMMPPLPAEPTPVEPAADTTALRHVHAALLFRAARHAAFPGADPLEAALELNEGIAEYTGIRVAYDNAALTDRVAALTEAGEKRTGSRDYPPFRDLIRPAPGRGR